ncbi:hypothetical protein NCG97_24995 [Streptomyces lydicamycinicus]|uniref:hypothetical protein n=1 Tax=Streptomyces lydicamycinicus TaxID=1546107 RepID=UPI002034C9E9|nr:hypothetical protein [Streptomyces lydicamycinicus]USA03159.1 hypothetical protein NCG97_24995 [Streptomyces lydicamycinicus]
MDAQGQPGERRRIGRPQVRRLPVPGLDPEDGAFGETREVGWPVRPGDDGAGQQGTARVVLVRGQGGAYGVRGRGVDS